MLQPKALRDNLWFVNNETVIGIMKDGQIIASDQPDMSAYLVRIFAQIDALELPRPCRIAHLGGGLGLLPKMLMGYGYDQYIYEIDPDIVAWLQCGILGEQATFITGDWRDTLVGMFDVIVYDIDAPVHSMADLRSHLSPSGTVLTLTQQEQLPL